MAAREKDATRDKVVKVKVEGKTMSKAIRMSTQTRTNWVIDAAVFLGAVLASISGIYFLFKVFDFFQPVWRFRMTFRKTCDTDTHFGKVFLYE